MSTTKSAPPSYDNITPSAASTTNIWLDPSTSRLLRVSESVTSGFARSLVANVISCFPSLSTSPHHILDLACGTGVVTSHLQAQLPHHHSITCADSNARVLAILRDRIKAEDWDGTSTLELDMTDAALPDASFDVVLNSFGPAVVPDNGAEKVLREVFRVLRPGGVFGFTWWIRVGWITPVTEAMEALRTRDDRFTRLRMPVDATEFAETYSGGPWWNREFMQARVSEAGFVRVQGSEEESIITMTAEELGVVAQGVVSTFNEFWWKKIGVEVGDEELGEVRKWLVDYLVQDQKGGKVVWDGWRAMIVTARKPE